MNIMNKEEFNEIRWPGSIRWEDAVVITEAILNYKEKMFEDDEDYKSDGCMKVLELGAFMGLCTIVIEHALSSLPGFFDFTSVDIIEPGKEVIRGSGKLRNETLPDDAIVDIVTEDALKYMQCLPSNSFDMVIEDTTHQTDYAIKLIPEIMRILKPGGIALFHDLQLRTMQKAFKRLHLEPELFPPSWMGALVKV